MRGRRDQPSSSGAQEQNRMAPRKQVNKDGADIPSGSQQADKNSQEDDRDESDELSSSLLPRVSLREKRKRERDNRSKPKEMTEEEMVDLALRLSEQEASITALRLQKEEETMMKAIQDSMLNQTQPCAPSQSQSLLADGAALKIGSRRKLMYSNGKSVSADDQGASEESDQNQGKQSEDERNSWSKKRKRKEGSPLPEMPDLSQTQKIDSQASDCSSDVVELISDSPQSCDSTQIEDCQLRESPVFPSTGCRAEVHVPRLSQDLLQTCRTSGFVLCSQDSLTSSLKPSSARPESPTFPISPKHSSDRTEFPKSPVLSETEHGDDGETELSPEYLKSPVFGRNTQREKSPSACKPQTSACNSGFTFSTQDSLTSSERTASHRPKSPVFPRCPSPSKNPPGPETSATRESPVNPETSEAQTEQILVFTTEQRQRIHVDEQKRSASPSAAELRDAAGGSSQSRRQDRKTGADRVVRCNRPSKSDDENLRETSKEQHSAEMELTSDMTLLLSDEDTDVTPVGSPSPVFPEERPAKQDAFLNHVTAAPPGTTRSNCRPSSSSTSSIKQQSRTTEQELQPISSQGSVRSAAPQEPAGGATVHYYWGVPFCPRGLDPDDYTQVILAQMEVYEKSLKRAQRRLLRKAEWGEAVLPQPEKSPSPEPPAESPEQLFSRRRGLKLKSKKVCDEADASPAEAEEEDKRAEEEERKKKEEEKIKGGREDSDNCEVCPETQLSVDDDDDRTQDLMMDNEAAADLRPKSSEPPEVDLILQDDSPARDELQEEEMEVDVDAPVDRRMTGSVPVSSSDDGRHDVRKQEADEDMEDPDEEVEVKNGGLQRSTSPELEAAVVPEVPEGSVDCPICQGSFPVTEIEMHAAYCDGEADDRKTDADCFQVSSKQRRKRTRRAEVTADDGDDAPSRSRNQEKCFICQKAVPLRDYSRHTELCIQRRRSKAAAKENLLSALEKTESRDSEAGPSGSKLQSGDVIDLLDDDDQEDEEEGGASAICISNSPIRSFTPISEATDCLIDFKKQQRAKKPSRRRR